MKVELKMGGYVTESGVTLPRVSDIIYATGLYSAPWVQPHHLQRGEAVHHALDLMDRGTLDWRTVDGRIVPYLDAYSRFVSESKWKSTLAEEAIGSTTLGFAGQIDRFGYLFGPTNCLLEIKTGSVPKKTGLQLWAYELLLREEMGLRAQKLLCVCLTKKGTYKLREVERPDEDTTMAFWEALDKLREDS